MGRGNARRRTVSESEKPKESMSQTRGRILQFILQWTNQILMFVTMTYPVTQGVEGAHAMNKEEHGSKEETLLTISRVQARNQPGDGQMAKSVCLIEIPLDSGNKRTGTGFLAKTDFGGQEFIAFCTAGHVMTKGKQLVTLSTVKITFNLTNEVSEAVQLNLSNLLTKPYLLYCAHNGDLTTFDGKHKTTQSCAPDLDFCLIKFTSPVQDTDTFIKSKGLSALTVAEPGTCLSFPNDSVKLCGFPNYNETKSILRTLAGKEVQPSDPNNPVKIAYDLETMGGASGSPVFNKAGRVKAIHVAGVDSSGGNWGVSLDAIRDAVGSASLLCSGPIHAHASSTTSTATSMTQSPSSSSATASLAPSTVVPTSPAPSTPITDHTNVEMPSDTDSDMDTTEYSKPLVTKVAAGGPGQESQDDQASQEEDRDRKNRGSKKIRTPGSPRKQDGMATSWNVWKFWISLGISLAANVMLSVLVVCLAIPNTSPATYSIGGHNWTSPSAQVVHVSGPSEVLHPPMLDTPLGGHFGAVIGSGIFIGGGTDGEDHNAITVVHWSSNGTRWEPFPPLSKPRVNACVEVTENKIISVRGGSSTNPNMKCKPSMEVYDEQDPSKDWQIIEFNIEKADMETCQSLNLLCFQPVILQIPD